MSHNWIILRMKIKSVLMASDPTPHSVNFFYFEVFPYYVFFLSDAIGDPCRRFGQKACKADRRCEWMERRGTYGMVCVSAYYLPGTNKKKKAS